MQKTFKEHLEGKFPFLRKGKILVACSGGADSVVLTHLLHRNKVNIVLAHCNFSLRGKESDAEEDFVKSLAKDLEVPVHTQSFNTELYASENKLSVQMAARELRYRWFSQLLKEHKLSYVVTAHHLDDDLETFLINAGRGTGLRGLTGIPEINEEVVRPLLNFSREKIISYAEENKLEWKEDSSNKSPKYLRNKLRIDVIPKLKEENPALLQNFKKTREHLYESRLLIEDYMTIIYKLVLEETVDGYRLNVAQLESLPNTKAILYELLQPFGFTEWGDVHRLLKAQSGKKVISPTHILIKDREHVLLTETVNERGKGEKEIHTIPENRKAIAEPIPLKFEEVEELSKPGLNTIFVDKEKLNFPLTLRKWEEGDFFYPFGMEGKKKLSKFFKDEKVSLPDKQKIWLLCSNREIVWVVGMRPDNRFSVDPSTKTILKIQH